jgi:hypothetical protein
MLMTSFGGGLWRVPKMIVLKKMPLSLAAQGAKKVEQKSNDHISLGATCQICMPLPWLIRSNFIKALFFQRYADILLACAGFIEEFDYGL